MSRFLTCVEICAGAGGQALGLALAGFKHEAVVELEPEYCEVLKSNRPDWPVICTDVRGFSGKAYFGVDLFAGGVPCPPFSVAGKQMGPEDERDLFPQALRLIGEIKPKAVMLENVRGFLDKKFEGYRQHLFASIESMGYRVYMQVLHASDFGVPQLRPRVVIVALRDDVVGKFSFPKGIGIEPPTVGECLLDLMAENGWKQASMWAKQANTIAPTLVGGSKKHGGPDLGPTRAKKAWALLGVDGNGVANTAPDCDFEGMPRLTARMMARLQGFADSWDFGSKKTAACRMIGNAFPPAVSRAVGVKIKEQLQ